MKRRWWLFDAALLAIASRAVLALLASRVVIPSLVRDPLSDFVQPGIAIWWLAHGGPFRTIPYSAPGIAFAAAVNAAFWLMVFWFGAVIVGAIQNILVARRS
jgi:hypothetical protein